MKEKECFRLRRRHKFFMWDWGKQSMYNWHTPRACIYTCEWTNGIYLTYTRRNGNGVRVTNDTHDFLSSWSSLVAEFVMRQIGDDDPHVIQNVCREIRFNLAAKFFFYHLSAFNPFTVDSECQTHFDAWTMPLFIYL